MRDVSEHSRNFLLEIYQSQKMRKTRKRRNYRNFEKIEKNEKGCYVSRFYYVFLFKNENDEKKEKHRR